MLSTLPAPISAPPHLYAGTSGWAYPTWKPGFYPPALPQKRFLEFYSSQLNSVEVNYTFRTLPTPKMLQSWLSATSPNFLFSFKAPQQITHFKRLKSCDAVVHQLLETLEPVAAQNKLGVLLLQLPPNFKANPALLNSFLQLVASALPSIRLAFEFRHESWFSEETYTILRAHNTALCAAEGDDLSTPEIHTATHICLRLRRSGGYSPAEIEALSTRLAPLSRQHDLFVYFRHEEEPTGALNASAFLAATRRVLA